MKDKQFRVILIRTVIIRIENKIYYYLRIIYVDNLKCITERMMRLVKI